MAEEKIEPKVPLVEDKNKEATEEQIRETYKKVFDLDENEVKSATSLYKALKDPETSGEIIEALARKAGLLDKKGDLKVDDKESARSAEGKIHKVLKTKLGKDYENFSNTIGPLLDEAVKEYLKEHVGKLNVETNAQRWESTVDTFMENREIPKKVETKMQELIEEAPPNMSSKTFNGKRYLERIWKAALSELDMPVPKKDTDEINDFPKNFKVINRPEKVTTDDAIEAAMKGIRFK